MKSVEIRDELIVLCMKIFQYSGVDANKIVSVDFINDLAMDSITFITLVVKIETHFNLTISDDILLMEYFRNIESIVDVIINQMQDESGNL